MRCSLGTEVAFARNWKCSKIPPILWRADSALARRISVVIFRSEIVALRTSWSPTSELQTKFYCAALGEARIANHEVSALAYTGHLASASPRPYSTSR